MYSWLKCRPGVHGSRVVSALMLIALGSCGGDAAAPNTAPAATIASPADGTAFSRLDVVSFQGSGTDAEDGALDGGSLSWSSQLDGALGSGASFMTPDLSVGNHAITLTARDSQGLSGTASIALEVTLRSAGVSLPVGSSVPGCEVTAQCFLPASVTIDVGGSVTWTNDDTAAHTVTSGTSANGPDGLFDSSLFLSGSSFAHSFAAVGTFDYFCLVHPWSVGQVTVQ